MTQERHLKLFSVFTGIYVTVLLLANVTSQKLFALGPFSFPGGVVVFPIAFIFNDILTEVYGYRLSRKVIWTGFFCQILAVLTYLIVAILPPASFWPHQDAYIQILGVVPRIIVASMLAYCCGEFVNSYVLSRMKFAAKGRRGLQQGWRFVASTVVGEAVDSAVFMLVAFGGVYAAGELIRAMLSLYMFKVVYEIIATPISTRFADWVKRVEGVDELDDPSTTNYSPFSFRGQVQRRD